MKICMKICNFYVVDNRLTINSLQYISFKKLIKCLQPCSKLLCNRYEEYASQGWKNDFQQNVYIVTDLINALPGNGSVNTVQHVTIEKWSYTTRF
jgi:hypothetical protein